MSPLPETWQISHQVSRRQLPPVADWLRGSAQRPAINSDAWHYARFGLHPCAKFRAILGCIEKQPVSRPLAVGLFGRICRLWRRVIA
jgi:hypothetical protein